MSIYGLVNRAFNNRNKVENIGHNLILPLSGNIEFQTNIELPQVLDVLL